jgi:hypothetical protein
MCSEQFSFFTVCVSPLASHCPSEMFLALLPCFHGILIPLRIPWTPTFWESTYLLLFASEIVMLVRLGLI